MKEKEKSCRIKEVRENKIILLCDRSWAICLDAQKEPGSSNLFSLINDDFNQKKMKIIFSNFFFSLSLEKKRFFFMPCLREYQKKDIEFFNNKKQAVIFSEMRTGKTPIALLVYKNWPTKKLLVVVPSILQFFWQKEIKKWLNQPSYIISYLKKNYRFWFYKQFYEEKKEIIIIVSKDVFKLDKSFFQKIKREKNKKTLAFLKEECAILVDEAHFLRNYNSQQSKSILNLSFFTYKIVLTGTPIINHFVDVFGILKFLNPKEYFSYTKFVENYFVIQQTKIHKNNGVFWLKKIQCFLDKKKEKELIDKINSLSVKRKQKDVLFWLPKIIHRREHLLMEKEQQLLYEKILKQWKKNVFSVGHRPIEMFSKLKTITLFPKILGCKDWGVKFNFLKNYFREYKKNSIIVFSTRSSTFLLPLAKELEEKEKIKVELITGKTNEKKKQTIILDFQEKKINFLFCNIKVASLGLNLSRADTIIFADRDYSPSVNEQAESRFLPTTNQESNFNNKLIIELICVNSIDERINSILKEKKNIIQVLENDPNFFF